ncbi:MAG: flavodoxin [Treponema sp.]|nr:flavodoxin [Treponema sp.]
MTDTLVIYYSLEGNTDYVAKLAARKLQADIVRIEPIKAYPRKGFRKFLIGGRDAVFSVHVQLQTVLPDFSQYAKLLIGTPVWAGTMAAPMNTLLHSAKIRGKHIALFACSASGNAKKCFAKMKALLPENTIDSCVSFINPVIHAGTAVDEQIDELAFR